MKTPLLLIALAGLALATPLAAAQQSSSVTVQLVPPERPLSADKPSIATGTVFYVADLTAYASLSGIPVQYAVTRAPAWASVVVTPANDVFPVPSTPSVTYVTARSITLTIAIAADAPAGAVDVIEITAMAGAAPLGRSAEGLGSFLVTTAAAPRPTPCPDAPAAAPESATAPASPARGAEARVTPQEGGEVTVQQAAASPVSTPWLVVGAFGLVGAGVGIVIRRRFVG
jgi:hypothetical protein